MFDVQQNRIQMCVFWTLKEYLGTFKCVRLLPWCTGWKVQLWLGGWYKMEPSRLFRYHKKENLVLQCSPWPEVTYVNNSPSPGFNNTHNSFPVAEGYDFFTLPPMSPGTVELHLIKKKRKDNHMQSVDLCWCVQVFQYYCCHLTFYLKKKNNPV